MFISWIWQVNKQIIIKKKSQKKKSLVLLCLFHYGCFISPIKYYDNYWSRYWGGANAAIYHGLIFVLIIIFWVSQNASILNDCHSKDINFEWLSFKIYTFWVTVTQKIYILSDCHSKDIHFEWLSLKRYTFWVTVTQKIYILSDCHSKY